MGYDPLAKHHGQHNDLTLIAESNLALESQCLAEFSSSPNQTHLSKPFKLFGVITKIQVGEFDQGLS